MEIYVKISLTSIFFFCFFFWFFNHIHWHPNTASDNVTNYVTRRMFNTNILYSCAYFVLKIDEKFSPTDSFNAIQWRFSIASYFFGPPCKNVAQLTCGEGLHFAVVRHRQAFVDLLQHPLSMVLVLERSAERKATQHHRVHYDSATTNDNVLSVFILSINQ